MTIRSGVARGSITPPAGITMAGYAAREGPAIGAESELYVTALIIDNLHTRVAVLAFDLLFIQEPLASAMREEIGQALGTPTSHITLNCSHTHCGPTSDGLQYDEDDEQHRLRTEYTKRLRETAVLTTLAALAMLKPARMATACGE